MRFLLVPLLPWFQGRKPRKKRNKKEGEQLYAVATQIRTLPIELSTMRLFAFEHGFTFFKECRDTFLLILCRKTNREKIDLASKPFVEVRA